VIPGVSYEQRSWDDIEVDAVLPAVRDEITYRRVIMNPATTWDYFPGHHDPEYARTQGQPTIYINTMHFLGFVDRVATDWAGPRSFITRRKVSLVHSIFAGDTMVAEGRVTKKYTDESGDEVRHLVELEINVKNQDGVLCCPALVTLTLPTGSVT
jgi:acyl dehydratase